MSPPDRLTHLAIVCARWALGFCALLAGPVVAIFGVPFTCGIASDILDQAGAAAMILSVGGVMVLLLLGRPAVRSRLKRAARLPLTPRNRSAGAPAQPI
jgi:hypothetical protein